jgi:4-amino-4-deoxy-L-arabinose transferase-like glycosyltransferase
MSPVRIWDTIAFRKTEYLVLGLIVLLGTFLRFYELDLIPVGLSGDEGADGLGARRILSGKELPLFITEDFGEEPIHTYLVALSFALWGVSLWAIRFVSAAIGVLTIPVIYWLARELLRQEDHFPSVVATISAFLVATSYWHIIYSRAGLEVVDLPLFSSALFYFLWRGIRTARRWAFLVSGLILGASLYSYRGARFLPILLTLFFGGWIIISRDFRRRHFVNLVLVALVAATVCVPLGLYAVVHPDIFFARELHVSVFNPDWGRGSPLQAFSYAALKTLGMYNFQGDPEFDRNPGHRPVLDPLSSLLFVVGLVVVLWQWKRPNYLFTAVWFLVMSLPGAFTAEALPHFHRGIGALPPLCLLCALGATWVKERLETAVPWPGARAASWAVLGLMLLPSAVLSCRDYFGPWQRRLAQGEIVGRGYIEAAEVMNSTRVADGVWILPASSLRPRNLPYYEVSFLYQGPEPEHTLDTDEETAPAELSDLSAGHREAAVINWKEFVLEEAYLSLNSDPKGLIDFLLRKYGQRLGSEPHQSFDLVTYRLPPATDFAIASSFEPSSVDFGDELRLEGIALGGSSLKTTSTPEEVERKILPSGKDAWVVLQWRAVAKPKADYKVAVYLLDSQGRVVGQADKLLLSNVLETTSRWDAGQLEMDYYTLPCGPATPPGKYTVQVTAYDASTMQRLSVFDPETGAYTTSIAIGELQVVKPLTPAEVQPQEQLPPSQVDIAPGVQLLGYDLSARASGPGETVRIALFWRATQDVSRDYLVSLELRDDHGESWLVQQDRPVDGTYPTTEWEKGETLRDWHDLKLLPDTPAGDYELLVQVLEGGETIGHAQLGSIEVQGRAHQFETPEIQHPLEASLGDTVQLLGYDLSSDEVKRGDTLHLTLYWQASSETQVSYTVFTHLLDASERTWGQMDSLPLKGEAPTTSWIPGEILTDGYDIAVDPASPPGSYVVEIGMYDATTGQRLPVLAGGQRVEGDRVVLGQVEVLP